MRRFSALVLCFVLLQCAVKGFCQGYTDRDDVGFDPETGLWEYEDRSVATPMYDHYNRSYEFDSSVPGETVMFSGSLPSITPLDLQETYRLPEALYQGTDQDEPDENEATVEKNAERK